eukprot:Em0005g867a
MTFKPHQVDGYNLVRTFAAVHTARMGKLGHLSSETGVQQGDPLGPLLFSLVLQRLISSIGADDDCIQVLFQAWYLDDGVLTGKHSAVLRALSLIEELGPSLGIHINLAKCELFSHFGNSMFPPAVKFSHHLNLEILGAPIGDYLYCSKFIAGKCADARKLLSSLVDVAAVDPHVALSLLRLCGSYCRLVHLARATPSSLAGSLKLFDEEVRRCFSSCFSIDTTDTAWTQAQLSLGFGGLGLRSLSHHSCAASLSTSGCSNADNVHLQQAIIQFNDQVSTSDAITAEAVSSTPVTQRSLSKKLECHLFNSLLGASSMADRARLLSVSASHAASWMSVTPSLALGLHLKPNELHASIRWWLGLDTSGGSLCPVCSQKALAPLGHHATAYTHGGHVVTRHNLLRDVVANLFRQAHMGVTVEAGYGLTHDNSHSRPADVLVTRWEKGLLAALDITVTSPLNPAILDESCSTAGAAAVAAESRKHVANDPKCFELGWTCVPLAVQTYGNWGVEAQETSSRLASLLAASHSVSKSKATADINGCLNLTLTSGDAIHPQLRNVGSGYEAIAAKKSMKHYQDDLVASSLEAQLEILATVYSSTEKPTFEVIKSYVISLSLVQHTSISEICILVKLILVSPATNAIRTFSPVRGCTKDVVYPLDRLNVSSCDTQKLVLGWNINQKIYDISLRYLCVNPSGGAAEIEPTRMS